MRTVALAVFAVSLELAAGASLAQVEVQSPWARATVPGQKTAGAYLQLKSAQGANLIGAESPVAAIVEVHEMRMEGNVMRMRAVPRLELPAGKLVELKPGGYHIMLIDLRQPLKNGRYGAADTQNRRQRQVDIDDRGKGIGAGLAGGDTPSGALAEH